VQVNAANIHFKVSENLRRRRQLFNLQLFFKNKNGFATLLPQALLLTDWKETA
jgi:hypothetical protein